MAVHSVLGLRQKRKDGRGETHDNDCYGRKPMGIDRRNALIVIGIGSESDPGFGEMSRKPKNLIENVHREDFLRVIVS